MLELAGIAIERARLVALGMALVLMHLGCAAEDSPVSAPAPAVPPAGSAAPTVEMPGTKERDERVAVQERAESDAAASTEPSVADSIPSRSEDSGAAVGHPDVFNESSVAPTTGEEREATDSEIAAVDETDLESRPDTPDLPEDDESWRYEFRELHDPNGIGKFYMDREIAWVMGFPAAPWLERPEREKEEATSELIKALNLKLGMVVADIGAGSGVLTLPIAKRVGPRGTVYAVDVQQEMLDRLSGRARSRNVRNIRLVLGTEKSPRLKPESVDVALMVDVYHEFAFPYEMIREISRAMKTGGRVVFVEFRLEDPNVPIKLVHKMSEEQVKKEIGLPEFRLKWKETIGTLPWQHVIVFEKQAEAPAESATESAPDK